MLYYDFLKYLYYTLNQIQPWHTQSARAHTVVMAVAREQPSRLCDTATGLFNRQCELFDEHLEEKSQVEICENFLCLLNEVTQIELDINLFRTKRTESNAGNAIKTDVKHHIKCA